MLTVNRTMAGRSGRRSGQEGRDQRVNGTAAMPRAFAPGHVAQVVLTQDPVRQQARLLMLKMPPILKV